LRPNLPETPLLAPAKEEGSQRGAGPVVERPYPGAVQLVAHHRHQVCLQDRSMLYSTHAGMSGLKHLYVQLDIYFALAKVLSRVLWDSLIGTGTLLGILNKWFIITGIPYIHF
jgi:hypothetical protein